MERVAIAGGEQAIGGKDLVECPREPVPGYPRRVARQPPAGIERLAECGDSAAGEERQETELAAGAVDLLRPIEQNPRVERARNDRRAACRSCGELCF